MPAGRPTKYKPEYCQLLVDHMGQGKSFESFAGIIDTTETAIHRWKKKYPEFRKSYKRGRAKSRGFWEELGIEMVLAGQGNATAWIFNMKNRFGWRDKSEVEQKTSGQVNVNIHDYGSQHNPATKAKKGA